MKRLLAFVMVAVMLFSVSIIAHAEEHEWMDGTAQVTMTYSVDSTYCLWIPETIDVNTGYTFTAEMLNIRETEQLTVRISNLNNGCLTFTNESGKDIQVQFNNGDVAAIFTDSLTSDITLFGQLSENSNMKAGDYTATAEFTMSLEARQN